MSEAMLDSGHHWWLRCDDHDIAWFNGGVEEPAEEDWGRNPCPMCIMEASYASRIAALEVEVAQARERALEEAARDCRERATECERAAGRAEAQGRDDFAAWHRAGAAELLEQEDRIRALKSKPAREARCSCSDPECLLNCPTHGRPAEMASEENGLLPKKRRREHEYGEETKGHFGSRIAKCVRLGCEAFRVKGKRFTQFHQKTGAEASREPGPCEAEP